MGRSRLSLQTLLATLMENPIEGQPPLGKVFFQPKMNTKMSYPCIVYARDQAKNKFANNSPYAHTKRYQVTIIDEDPDSVIPDRVAALPMSTFQRHFATDNLNHDIYSLYF
jgi:hypothetical protein